MEIDGNKIDFPDLAWTCECVLRANDAMALADMSKPFSADRAARMTMACDHAREARKFLNRFIKSVEQACALIDAAHSTPGLEEVS